MTIFTELTQNSRQYGVPSVYAFYDHQDAIDRFFEVYEWYVNRGYDIELYHEDAGSNNPRFAVFKIRGERAIITLDKIEDRVNLQ